jgi:hypothetical protein
MNHIPKFMQRTHVLQYRQRTVTVYQYVGELSQCGRTWLPCRLSQR